MKLTGTILSELIDKITSGETQIGNGEKTVDITIYYRFVGVICSKTIVQDGCAMKIKSMLTIIVLTVFVGSIALLGLTLGSVTNQMTIKNNSEKLRDNVLQMPDDVQKINLCSLTSFEWENVYFFDPYQSKKEIFEALGFKWYGVKQQTSEGMMQIIFVNDGRVVCYCNGYGEDNGYFIDGDIHGEFSVLKNNGNLTLLRDDEQSQKLGYTYMKYSQ